MSRNNQKGSAALAIIGGILIFLVVGVVAVALAFMSVYNTAKNKENGLVATYQNNQNLLATYSQKVVEAAQVNSMMAEDLRAVAKEALAGRYGKDGSRAVFQMIQEQNPVVPASLAENLQTIVVAGRDAYQVGQQTQIDKLRDYKNYLQNIPGGFMAQTMGFPREDLKKFEPIITDSVERTYQTGKEAGPIQLRPSSN